MRNSDMPAMPLAVNEDDQGRWWSGLTKREHFAAMAMQGLLSADFKDEANPAHVAKAATGFADALLAELERTK